VIGEQNGGVVNSGFVVVDKPAGMTSHAVVSRVRRIVRTRRVGHGGTLDPMATGVLVVGVERGTRLLTYLLGGRKRYEGTIRLGQSTLTDDAEGEILDTVDASAIAEDTVRTALAAMTGDIAQVPSSVSAIKVDGRRSYARVRAGETVTLDARPVTVYRLEPSAFRRPAAGLVDLDVDVECSSGTYIRAIARDLGAVLGVGGHLTALRRTAVGSFTLADASTLDELADAPDPVTVPLPVAADRLFPRRDADPAESVKLSNGVPLSTVGIDGPYAVFDPAGQVIAVVRERDGKARPEVVLRPGEN
jgi:tRNA pseudouridine55 synthase